MERSNLDLFSFSSQCYDNMGHAIATQKGLSIEYDEDVCCDVCQSVSNLEIFLFAKVCYIKSTYILFFACRVFYFQTLHNLFVVCKAQADHCISFSS